jgi:hypothetical protein
MLSSKLTKDMGRVRADEAARLKMQDHLRSAADSMETPNDTMLRLFNGVCVSDSLAMGITVDTIIFAGS